MDFWTHYLFICCEEKHFVFLYFYENSSWYKEISHISEERDTILDFLIENCCCGYVRVIVVFLLTSTPIYVNLGKDWVIVHIFDYLADLINVLFFAVHTSSVISSFNMTRTSCFY